MREKANRLASETSPYLLQHAHNPVDWYPWGPEALERAKREDKPILLSIGYAACHWCHVMERESFENEAVAALMNEHFVSIKVDREERPDLDDIYMAATVAMTGRGGWPMTVFLAPDQRPFFAGTYFPPERRHGLPGFAELLGRVAEVWRDDRAGVDAQANELSSMVREQLGASAASPIPAGANEAALKQLADAYDPKWGGFGRAPKFPPCPALRLLLRQGGEGLALARGTLDGMANGGIYDHVGGGFARYSTDERWHVPHFEKMLYDNGQLARVYVEAHQVTGESRYRRVAEETLDYLLREMQSPQGGFYSATDADSEGVEGKFFTFTEAELQEILGERARAFNAYYGVLPEGNWEETNVLWTPRAIDEVAGSLGLSVAELEASLTESRIALYAARQQRVPPLLDDKILVSWNGLAIGALAEAARVFGSPRYRAAAERAADDLLTRFVRPDGGLYRTARADRVHLDAYLEDYACFASALIDLYEAGAAERYLVRALELCARMVRDFADTEGGFFQTAHEHEALLARPRDSQDDAMPNANAIAAEVCARLAAHFARDDLRSIAERAVARAGSLVMRAPRAFASTLAVADLLARGPVEVAIIGPEAESEPLRRAVAQVYLPNRILGYGLGSGTLPLLAGKTMVGGAPAVYVCRDFACEAPLTRPEDVVLSLQRRASG
jgi:uncharacterized protein